MELLGIFQTVDEAALAVDKLLAAGCAERQITSVTSVSYPDGVLVDNQRRSWFHWMTVGGGLLGACAGFLLAAGTAWLYPLQTGDKPIISLFTTGIITYEVMMLCAMIGTMLGMFLEMGLPDLNHRAYDPEIANGLIGISVNVSGDELCQRAKEALNTAGALRICNDEVPK
jgi:hypothetical protein